MRVDTRAESAAKDARDREIRRRFFKLGHSAARLRADFKCSNTLLTRVLGQSPGGRGTKIESIYGE